MIGKAQKQAVLWNVLDPDDAYDIRRSMIARLPDHPTRPMAGHLQLVCLLQAAEIERLSDYLTEMKSKYREIERRELDRHSYEVQIKEILYKNIHSNNLKSENDKLKDYIRRQQLEMEELQKRSQQSANLESLQAKYEGLLYELQIAREQKENSEKTAARLSNELSQWKARYQRLEKEKNGLSVQLELQMKERLNIQVKLARQKAQERADKLAGEMKQLRDILQSKNQEIKTLLLQKQQLSREIRLLQEKSRIKGNLQDSINEKNKQVQRLSVLLNEKTIRLEQVLNQAQLNEGEFRLLEDRYSGIERQRDMLVLRLRQVEAMRVRQEGLDRLEEKVAMMSMEIERLNGLNNIRSRELAEATAELERLRVQLRGFTALKQQAQRDKQRVLKLQMELQVLQPNQAKIALMSQELQRMNVMLKGKNDEVTGLQQKLKLSQTNTGQLASILSEKSRLEQQLQAARTEQRNFRTITESEINSLKGENFKLRQEIDQGYASKSEFQKYRAQADRLRIQIQRIRLQGDQLRRNLQQEKSLTLKTDAECRKLAKQNEAIRIEMVHLRQQSENVLILQRGRQEKEKLILAKDIELGVLQKKLAESKLQCEDMQRRNVELSESTERIYLEIERLHNLLASKTADLQKVVKENSVLEERCRFYQSKFNNNIGEKEYYEKEIARIKIELETAVRHSLEGEGLIQQRNRQIGEHLKERQFLQKKIVQLQRDLSNKISSEQLLRKQYERLTKLIQVKDARMREIEKIMKDSESASREADAKAKQWQARILQWESRLQQNQERNKGQEESLRLQLQMCEEALSRQRKECQALRLKNRAAQQNVFRVSSEIEALKGSIKQYQMKIVHIQSTNSRVIQQRGREDQQKLQERDNLIINLQKQIKQIENQLTLRDTQISQSRNRYEDSIAMMSVELERLKAAVQERTNESREKDRLIQQLKMRLGSQEGQDSSDAERYRIEITNLQTALEELQNINFHTAAERDELFQVSHELKDQLDEHLRRASEENRILRADIQAKIEQIRRYGEELGTLKMREQSLILKIKSLEQVNPNQQSIITEEKYTVLYEAYKQLYANYHLQKSEHEASRSELRNYEAKIFQLEREFQNLTQALRALQNQRDQYKRELYETKLRNQEDGDLYEKNLVLSREIDRLSEENVRMKDELAILRLRITNEVSLQKRIEEQLGLLVVLFAEVESLRSRLQSSQRECEEVRRSSLSPFRVDRNPRS